jgi:hypothetical protein
MQTNRQKHSDAATFSVCFLFICRDRSEAKRVEADHIEFLHWIYRITIEVSSWFRRRGTFGAAIYGISCQPHEGEKKIANTLTIRVIFIHCLVEQYTYFK